MLSIALYTRSVCGEKWRVSHHCQKQSKICLKIWMINFITCRAYCVSLCHHTIVCHLILNAWLLIGCYEIRLKLQLSSMSLDALNVLLLGQAVLTIVPQSSSVASGSPTVRRPKSRDLKPANPSPWCHLSCDIPLFPIHTRSKAAERMEPWGHGIKVWFLFGLSNIRLVKQYNRWMVVSAEELT